VCACVCPKVLAIMKNTLLVVVSATFLQEVVTGLQFAGYAVTMVGFLWYQVSNRSLYTQRAPPPMFQPQGWREAVMHLVTLCEVFVAAVMHTGCICAS
jgi:hypothetical protein